MDLDQDDAMKIFDVIPEARAFYEEVINREQEFRLYPDERFIEHGCNIIIHSAPDLHNEQFDLEEFDSLVAEFNRGKTWLSLHHDPTLPYVGRILAARVFPTPEDGVSCIIGVYGYYDTLRLPTFDSLGLTRQQEHATNLANLALEDEGTLDGKREILIKYNLHEISEEAINEIIATQPDSIAINTEHAVRKAAETKDIILVLGGVLGVLNVPLLKKLQEDVVWPWLVDVARRISRVVRGQRVLYVLEEPYRGCKAEFIIDVSDSDHTAIVQQAVKSIENAEIDVTTMIDRFGDLYGLTLISFWFDSKSLQWVPKRALSTKKGPITDQPILFEMGRRSLSVEGTAHRALETKGSD